MTQGIRTILSQHSVDDTAARLQGLLEKKGVKIFTLIDHSGEAAAAGLAMRPTKVLVFGNPKAGTPVMLATPSAALDLPLRILIAESEAGEVLVSWNDPAWLQQRHGFPTELIPNLAAVEDLAKAAAE